MSKRGGPWDDGHRAWARVTSWHTGGRKGSGEAALEAMADIGTLRRLLDQAELSAVCTARWHAKSWAEIATQLGITRQSAWERWRELDDDMATPAAPEPEGQRVPATTGPVAVRGLAEGEPRGRRRVRKVVVPDVVGSSFDDARQALLRAGLQAAGPDPDGLPLGATGWPRGVVVDQAPESGAKVPAGSLVTLWLEEGGGSAGVREPRRPSPMSSGPVRRLTG
jgi:hypothetical protein